MNRPKKHLFDIEIDEVSVVDRPANQHGVIAFSKALGDVSPEEGQVGIYDSEGYEVDPDELEHGDVVYSDAGDELVYVEDDELEDELVGKANPFKAAAWGARNTEAAGILRGVKGADNRAAYYGGRTREHVGRNKKWYIGGGTAAALAGAGGAGYYNTNKSLGDSVIEELSKAVGSAERDEVIAKAMDEVEFAKAAAEEAWVYAASIEDQRIEEAFISKAAEYNLPVSPDILGPILKSISEVLSDEELDILDQIFDVVGDALYEEVGYVGDTDNTSVLDTVNAYASELVGKADVSHAEAMTAMFAANPTAYDAYLSENGR